MFIVFVKVVWHSSAGNVPKDPDYDDECRIWWIHYEFIL